MSRSRPGNTVRVLAALAVGLAGATAVGVSPAGAAATPAQKVSLTQTNRDCGGTVLEAESSRAHGFGIITTAAAGKLVAKVTLRDARPNTTYTIRLIQIVPDGADCQLVDGTLTTDATGAGTANVQEPVRRGASSAWIDLNNLDDFSEFYDTAPMSF